MFWIQQSDTELKTLSYDIRLSILITNNFRDIYILLGNFKYLVFQYHVSRYLEVKLKIIINCLGISTRYMLLFSMSTISNKRDAQHR